jgi:hypothetical protein
MNIEFGILIFEKFLDFGKKIGIFIQREKKILLRNKNI